MNDLWPTNLVCSDSTCHQTTFKSVSVRLFLQSIIELEAEMLNGQKLQGPQTSAEVYKLLQKRDIVNK